MAPAHFTTIPCEHYKENDIFAMFLAVLTTLYVRFEDFGTFLYVFMGVV